MTPQGSEPSKLDSFPNPYNGPAYTNNDDIHILLNKSGKVRVFQIYSNSGSRILANVRCIPTTIL
jgi:hypothetical protein